MNPLSEFPGARKVLYLVQWITTGLTGIAGLYFTSQGSTPDWYTTLVAVLAFVWTYTGVTAAQNVSSGGGEHVAEG